MWPMFIDYSDEDCRRVLRSFELEAYSSVINAFRAQGNLTKDKKKMLQDLSLALSVSMERHRSEVRRAINDEQLSTVSERLFGPNTITEWAIEGRRVVPLMQRLAPQTAFTEIANSVASVQAVKNSALPLPGKTGLREIINGIETMASRKRKGLSIDSDLCPAKILALDSQYLHNLLPFDTTIPDPTAVPDVSMSSERCHSPDVIPLASPFMDLNASKNFTASIMASMSHCSSSSKHPVPKTTSTVTTFSSFDQITSNLLASRAASQAHIPAVLHEEQVSTFCDVSKSSSDLKSASRSLPSHSSTKSSSTIVIPSPPSSSSSSVSSPSASKDRLQTLPCASQSNKFLTQIRSKTPSHTRQNLPAGLGIKLSPQSHMNQRPNMSPKSPMKSKQDNSSSIFTKKSPNVFPPPVPPALETPLPNDPTNINKSPVSKTTTTTTQKTECQTTLNAKQQTLAKPKTTASHNSQYISRSLFSTSSKSGAKSLSPVIFNVSSPSCTTPQTAPKMTGPSQTETQLLPKTTTVGMGASNVKLNTSTTPTFQYRNDGGVVRSARIVNITQPAGTRLPCAISPSAISALGLSANLSSTALRVTLPPGTLSTASSLRVSAAAKPNVIVVHKAQMWPRAQQGGAVIMSSAPLSKLSNDIAQETLSITQKQDRNKPSGSKTTSRTIASVRPQSPAVTVSSDKMSGCRTVSKSSITSTSRPESSSTEAHNSKSSENTSDVQCKKNLLADIMEASGILLENTARNKALKEKNNAVKNNKEMSNHQEVEVISQKSSISTTSETTSTRLPETNTSKTEPANISSGNTALTVKSVERNGVDTQKQGSAQAQSVESQSKDTCNTVVSSSHITNENVMSSIECGSKGQQEGTKDKDS